jgi:hypothetical protein
MNDKWSPREVLHRDYNSHPPAYAPGYKTSVLRSPRNALITTLSLTMPKKACRSASVLSCTATFATALAAR